MAIISRARLTIAGYVQGVFYRQTTCNKARSLGLVGWVRNAENGSVEIEVSGSRELVEELIAWCKVGPAAARVSQVYIDWLEDEVDMVAEHTGFQILF